MQLEDLQFDLAAEAFIMSEVIGPEVAEEAQVVAGEVVQNYDNKVNRRQLREVSSVLQCLHFCTYFMCLHVFR